MSRWRTTNNRRRRKWWLNGTSFVGFDMPKATAYIASSKSGPRFKGKRYWTTRYSPKAGWEKFREMCEGQ